MVTTLKAREIRKDFPLLQSSDKDTPLIYLDNAATTQKPQAVIDKLTEYYRHLNANVHRAIYSLGEKSTEAYEEARQKAALFINSPTSKQIVFTRGTTESINLVASAWGRKHINAGDEILLTEMEHHSNLVPWQLVAKERNASLKFIPIDKEGQLNLAAFEELLSEHTRIVALTHMSNVLGTINPLKQLIEKAHDRDIPVLVDGAQSVPHIPVDVKELDCDFLAFSGHKMLGPTGTGVLYAKIPLLEEMEPYQAGGEMIEEVTLHDSTYNVIPHKFEAGTPNIAGAVGFGAALDYLEAIGMEKVALYEQELVKYALHKMGHMPGMVIYGRAAHRGGAVSFNLGNIHPHDLAHFLDQQGVAVRAGHHCAQPLMKKLGVGATTRASFYLYNTLEEVDYFVTQLKEAQKFFNF